MKGNRWEGFLGFTTFGESHGKAIGVVIEDVKPNVTFPFEEIKQQLARRRPGRGEFSSPRTEEDELVVVSGVFEGKTTGMPICLLVFNRDNRSEDYEVLKDVFRPGHADLAWYKKYKIYDYRGGGRASGRETIARVAASALVNQVIEPMRILAYPIRIGQIIPELFDPRFVCQNELSWPCPKTYQQVISYLRKLKSEGNSVGGLVQVKITNVPAGLGDPVFEKLDANIAKAIVSIGSVKGIEFGKGFELGKLNGKEANDPIYPHNESGQQTSSGGISGGISEGGCISFRFVVKPTPSIAIPQSTINRKCEPVALTLKGRFDTCIIPRIIPIAEAMIKLVIADALSFQKQIEGNELTMTELREAIDKIDEDLLIALVRRKKIVSLVGELKKRDQLPIYQPDRESELLANLRKKGLQLGVAEELIDQLWKLIIADSRKMQ